MSDDTITHYLLIERQSEITDLKTRYFKDGFRYLNQLDLTHLSQFQENAIHNILKTTSYMGNRVVERIGHYVLFKLKADSENYTIADPDIDREYFISYLKTKQILRLKERVHYPSDNAIINGIDKRRNGRK